MIRGSGKIFGGLRSGFESRWSEELSEAIL